MNPEPPFDDPKFAAAVVDYLESLRDTLQDLRESVRRGDVDERALARLEDELEI